MTEKELTVEKTIDDLRARKRARGKKREGDRGERGRDIERRGREREK